MLAGPLCYILPIIILPFTWQISEAATGESSRLPYQPHSSRPPSYPSDTVDIRILCFRHIRRVNFTTLPVTVGTIPTTPSSWMIYAMSAKASIWQRTMTAGPISAIPAKDTGNLRLKWLDADNQWHQTDFEAAFNRLFQYGCGSTERGAYHCAVSG